MPAGPIPVRTVAGAGGLDLPELCVQSAGFLRRKEVIQPQVPLRLPCYDFIPVTSYTLGPCPLAVGIRHFGCDRLP